MSISARVYNFGEQKMAAQQVSNPVPRRERETVYPATIDTPTQGESSLRTIRGVWILT